MKKIMSKIAIEAAICCAPGFSPKRVRPNTTTTIPRKKNDADLTDLSDLAGKKRPPER